MFNYKKILQRWSKTPKILVAGIPRSGTTLLWRAIAGLPPGDTTPPDYAGPVKKTHSLAPNTLPDDYKAVFLFGDIIASVISTRLNRYSEFHFQICGSNRSPETTDIFIEDALNYEAMFDSWHRSNSYGVMCIRYETLFANRKIIEAFVENHLLLITGSKYVTFPGTR
jgi:hypothetical protein